VQNTQQKAKGTKVVRLPFAFGYAPLLLTMLAKAKDAKAKGAKVAGKAKVRPTSRAGPKVACIAKSKGRFPCFPCL
jgi:hypothetical protein